MADDVAEKAPVAQSTPEDTLLAEKTAALKVDDTQPKATEAETVGGAEPVKEKLPEDVETIVAPTTVADPKLKIQEPTETVHPHEGAVRTPLPSPLQSCKPKARPELTEDQVKMYEQLLAIVKDWKEVPTKAATMAPKEPLTDEDRLFLTKDCLLRYLRATKWDLSQATKRLMATLTWRREYGLLKFTHEYISLENETGKQVILGYDNEARPCLYLNPSKQNTERTPRQLQHLFYNLERVIELMPPGQESLDLLINFMDTKRGQGASLGQGKEVMDVLQNHYPERLGLALVTELPWYITTFFKLISPFIDPLTRTKLKFNETISDYIPIEQLLIPFGGDMDFEYQHGIYWPALDILCANRRRDYHERWVKAGKEIGESEKYLRGGDSKCLSGEFSGLDFKEGFTKVL